jgi:serine/threonine protein kinase
MRRESVILCSLNHPNIVKIFGVVPERGWIIMEYCTQGSLKSLLDDEERDFSLSELTKFALATASGLAYLHSADVSIIHGDLKADNVLVRENNSICLCDFGLSEAKNRSKTITGGLSPRGFTVQWTAPEILKNQPKTKATDVYSLAMTIWEIFERKNPYGDMLI